MADPDDTAISVSLPDAIAQACRMLGDGRLAEGLARLQAIVQQKPDEPAAQHYLGVALHMSGRSAEALPFFAQARLLDPKRAAIPQNQSLALMATGRIDEAVAAAAHSVELDPESLGPISNLIVCLMTRRNFAEADQHIADALKRFANQASLWVQKGHSALAQGRTEDAEQAFSKALSLAPSMLEARFNMGVVAQKQGRDAEALGHYDLALKISPGHAGATINGAICLRNLGQLAESRDRLETALRLDPGSKVARYNLAMVKLLSGDWPDAWSDYEERHAFIDKNDDEIFPGSQLWDGTILPTSTLLVCHEQGLGDTLQFIRFLPLVARMAGKVLFRCQPRLYAFLSRLSLFDGTIWPNLVLCDPSDPVPQHDAYIPLMSLPRLLKLRRDGVPTGMFRYPPPSKPAKSDGKFRVGLAWQGNAASGIDRGRSLAPGDLVGLISDQQNIHFFSLQHRGRTDPMPLAEHGLIWPETPLDDGPDGFLDSAALMQDLDLVITTDTSIAHLAGLLGRPCWLMLKAIPDWRWGMKGELTPWYPTLRLFRQNRNGDWSSVIERMKDSLHRLLSPPARPQAGTLENAIAHYRRGEFPSAIQIAATLVSADRGLAGAHNLLAMALLAESPEDRERMALAQDHAFHSTALAPTNPDLWSNLAALLDKTGRSDDGRRALDFALMANPAHATSLIAITRRHFDDGAPDLAREMIGKVLAATPDHPAGLALLATITEQRGQASEALATINRASKADPNNAGLHLQRGLMLSRMGHPDDAARAWEAVLVLDPEHADAWSNLGVYERGQDRVDSAIALLQRATELSPSHADAWCNRGISEVDAGQYDQAIASFRRALGLRAHYPEAELALGMALLSKGDLAQGLAHYQARLESFSAGISDHQPDLPLWRGEDLAGRIILILTEQGFGDAFQFIRHAADLKARGAGKVLVGCRPKIAHLLATAPGVDGVIVEGEKLPKIDCMAYMMSLPYLLGMTQWPQMPATPYLHASHERQALWAEWLKPIGGLKIGVSWQGNPDPKVDKGRSFPLSALATIASIDGVNLISLQQGFGAEQSIKPALGFPIILPGPDFDCGADAFADTAALMMGLDLIITSDTAIAHLAGALGRPVFLVLKSHPEWRWGQSGTTSPFYLATVLFRRHAHEADATPFAGVMERLAKAVAAWRDGQRDAISDLAAASPSAMLPVGPEANLTEAMAAFASGDLVAARIWASRALADNPNPGEALHVLGSTALAAHENHRAIIWLREALRHQSDQQHARTNLAIALRQAGLRQQADQQLELIMASDNPPPEAMLARANLYREAMAFEAAEALLLRLTQSHPGMAKGWRGLGNTRRDLGKLDAAIADLEHAASLTPDDPELLLDLAHAELSNGNLTRGFLLYENRWRSREMTPRRFDIPRWNGEKLEGTLLIHAEQGLGDAIQFVRFVAEAAKRVKKIVLEVRAPLVALFQSLDRLDNTIEIAETGSILCADAEIAMMSLPHVLGTSLKTLPGPALFHPDPLLRKSWRSQLSRDRLNIGLVWQGNPDAKADRGRSPPLAALAPLLARPSIQWVGLQKTDGLAQVANVPQAAGMLLPGDALGDFATTAALIAELDVVVSSCTASLHLAASLGVRTIGLIKFAGDWRWMSGRSDSPWYPALTLCRQTIPGDWSGPVNNARQLLDALVRS